eukprot:3419765-Rhodomonas_salina.1
MSLSARTFLMRRNTLTSRSPRTKVLRGNANARNDAMIEAWARTHALRQDEAARLAASRPALREAVAYHVDVVPAVVEVVGAADGRDVAHDVEEQQREEEVVLRVVERLILLR